MNGKLRLNLHCHSNLSDGVLSPEELAGRLADGGATIAALTDHDTVAGLPRFREALSLRGVAFVDAVELTTFCSFGEIHLLAYGIDADSAELTTTLAVLNNSADQELQSFMERLRRLGNRPHAGRLDTMAALDLVHRCGGIAILAHPLNITYTEGNLETLLDALSGAGLDGIEAYYDPYTRAEQERLLALAESHGLCVSMGTDFHVPDDPRHRMVMETDERLWRIFRDRLLRQAEKTNLAVSGLAAKNANTGHELSADEGAFGPPVRDDDTDSPNADKTTDATTTRLPASRARTAHPRLRLGTYSARIVGAAVVSLSLFVLAIFAFSIPYFEKTLLERKKEMIRELTAEAVSLIAEYAADETSGRATREEAQADAIAHIRDIRYGREGKDYFWITDMTPRMLLHPYRNDLEGMDVSDYQDDNGLRVFYEFTRAVRDESEGYVEYLWQWKDDTHRIVPKLSFVKRFVPWGWVIGTGIYLDDVQVEIGVLTSRMIWLSILIAAILLLLLVFIAYQSLRMEKEKQSADFAVRESRERYRALVDASSEGMVIVMDGACTFANAPFLALSAYTETEVVLLGISEFLVPYQGEEDAVVNFLAALPKNGSHSEHNSSEAFATSEIGAPLSCLFRTRSNELVDVVLYASAFSLAGKKGAVLSVKDARVRLDSEDSPVTTGTIDAGLAELISLGTIRARLHRRASILGADKVARRLLGMDGAAVPDRAILGGYFDDPEEWDAFYDGLVSRGRIVRKQVRLKGNEVVISALVGKDEALGGAYFSAFLEAPGNSGAEIEALHENALVLENAVRYLDEAVPVTRRRLARLPVDSTVRQAAELMTRDGHDALIVEDASGTGIGIITDEDLRLRVVAEGRDPDSPLALFMSSPLVGLQEGSTWGQALHLMREKNIGHVAVRDRKNHTVALVGRADLLELQADGFQVLLRAVSDAGSLAELARIRRRMGERMRLLAVSGVEGRIISGQFSSLDDAIINRLFSFAALDVGPAPAPFVFLNLGSGGRAENLPGSDQDNAIVFRPNEESKGEEKGSRENDDREKSGGEQAYFLRLGAYICDALDEIGAPWCPGGVMAKNEAWCAPLDRWERKFASWIASPEGDEMLSLNMSFDFRPVYGDTGLADQLRKKVSDLLADAPAFFTHLASEALRRRTTFPQAGSFFQGTTGEAEVDLKELASQFVLYTRLYALRDSVGATNTWSRVRALADSGAFGHGLAADCMDSYGFVSRLRIERQGEGPKLSLKSLKARDEAGLREAFAQAALIQKKIGFDFPGAALG